MNFADLLQDKLGAHNPGEVSHLQKIKFLK